MLELLGLMILAAACGGDAVTTTPTWTAAPTTGATVVPTAVPTAEPTVAEPLAVYSDGADIVVFDAGARREVRRVALPDGALSVVFTHERKVSYVVESNSDVQVHAIDPLSGADDAISRFPRPGDGARLLLSPDGRYAAFAFSDGITPPSRSTVGIVDLQSATTRVLATLGAEFRGLATPGKWRDDGSGFVIYGDTSMGPHAGSLATVMLDGSVTMHGEIPPSRLSPSGRAVMYDDVNTVGCVFAQPQRLRIYDLDADQDAAVVEDPGRGLVFNEWSPSGDELLYTRYDTMPARAEDCLPEFDRASGRSHVLSARGGAPTPVPDIVAVRTRWYGGVTVEYACEGGAPLNVWGQCMRGARIVLLNGVPVGSEDRVHLLGIISTDVLPADR